MAEARSFRVEAVVLRHSDWGEADRLLTLFTRERGKVRVVAKGIRRVRSRKAGHLEPFSHVTVQLARGRDLPIVTQADTLEPYLALREDLLRTGQAAYVIELVDRFTSEEETGNAGLFDLLTATLARVGAQPDPWAALRFFEVRLLDILGFRPQLFACAGCGQEIQPADQFFSPAAGGALCVKCGRGLPHAWPVTMAALKYFRHFQRSTFEQAARSHPHTAVREELEGLVQKYLTYLLERQLNSPLFLQQIRNGS